MRLRARGFKTKRDGGDGVSGARIDPLRRARTKAFVRVGFGGAESPSGDEESSSVSTETKARAFAPTFEEAVACVAEAMAAFPPASDGAAFARATLERWSGGGDEA